jgi:hypothetical protein
MNKLAEYGCGLLLLCIFIGCKPAEKVKASDEPINSVSASINELASAQAKITGKIIALDETLESEGPCAKAPCHAQVLILTLEKKGSLFQLPDIKDTLRVSFAYTLAPTTAELFPGMKTSYPGLKANDRFEAKLESRLTQNEQGVGYIIYEYKKFTYEK